VQIVNPLTTPLTKLCLDEADSPPVPIDFQSTNEDVSDQPPELLEKRHSVNARGQYFPYCPNGVH
jgi:hypothetical protein